MVVAPWLIAIKHEVKLTKMSVEVVLHTDPAAFAVA